MGILSELLRSDLAFSGIENFASVYTSHVPLLSDLAFSGRKYFACGQKWPIQGIRGSRFQ
jgi:hypothetical protein